MPLSLPKLNLLPGLRKLLPAGRAGAPKRDSLLFERLFWGALSGGLATILFAESPVLDTMEMNLLEWRYKTGHELNRAFRSFYSFAPLKAAGNSDVVLVTYDDEDQFDLEGEGEEGGAAPIQEVMARLVSTIESGSPLLLVLDLDLRGKADNRLVAALRANKGNTVLALPGSLDNPNDLPAAELRKSVLKCAFDHVIIEQNGLTCRMPILANLNNIYVGEGETASNMNGRGELVESLPEVVAPLMSARAGVGPSRSKISDFAQEELPIYIKFSGKEYPVYKARDILSETVSPLSFSNKVVLLGTNFSQKVDNTPRVRTPLMNKVPNIYIQAEAISTLSKNEPIRSFPRSILHHILLLIGGALGALSSTLAMGRRTTIFLTIAMLLTLLTQLSFQYLNVQVPVLPLLAVLMLTYIFGTLIYLDTDLRLRNRELAMAREAMQVRAEEERQRIAEDLHDETLPALSAVARMADKLTHEMDGSDTPRQMREKLDGAISEMRRVINDLHPSVLETMGFKPALENLLAILERETDIAGQFEDRTENGPTPPLDLETILNDFTRLQLYRIVQESLNNVQKHAQASEVKLIISQFGTDLAEEGLQIDIIDNGKGMDLDFSPETKGTRQSSKTSHGLINIRQRAQLIGAQVNWKKPESTFANDSNSSNKSGTQVTIKMTIRKKEEGNG